MATGVGTEEARCLVEVLGSHMCGAALVWCPILWAAQRALATLNLGGATICGRRRALALHDPAAARLARASGLEVRATKMQGILKGFKPSSAPRGISGRLSSSAPE